MTDRAWLKSLQGMRGLEPEWSPMRPVYMQILAVRSFGHACKSKENKHVQAG